MAFAGAPIDLARRPFRLAKAGLARWRERSDIGTGHTSQRREGKTHADRDSQQETLHDLKCARPNVALQARSQLAALAIISTYAARSVTCSSRKARTTRATSSVRVR